MLVHNELIQEIKENSRGKSTFGYNEKYKELQISQGYKIDNFVHTFQFRIYLRCSKKVLIDHQFFL